MKNTTPGILTLTLAQLYLSVAAFFVPRKALITASLVIRQGQGNVNGTLSQCETPCSPIEQYVGTNAPVRRQVFTFANVIYGFTVRTPAHLKRAAPRTLNKPT